MSEKEKTVREAIGTQIKKARLEKGLTQEQLAKKIGVEPTYLCKIERGRQWAGVQLLMQIGLETNTCLNVNFVKAGKKVLARDPLV